MSAYGIKPKIVRNSNDLKGVGQNLTEWKWLNIANYFWNHQVVGEESKVKNAIIATKIGQSMYFYGGIGFDVVHLCP